MNVKTIAVDARKLWMSKKEAQQYLGVSKDWLEARETDGVLNFSVVGKTRFYIKSQIDNMIRNGAVTGVDKFRDEK